MLNFMHKSKAAQTKKCNKKKLNCITDFPINVNTKKDDEREICGI